MNLNTLFINMVFGFGIEGFGCWGSPDCERLDGSPGAIVLRVPGWPGYCAPALEASRWLPARRPTRLGLPQGDRPGRGCLRVARARFPCVRTGPLSRPRAPALRQSAAA